MGVGWTSVLGNMKETYSGSGRSKLGPLTPDYIAT